MPSQQSHPWTLAARWQWHSGSPARLTLSKSVLFSAKNLYKTSYKHGVSVPSSQLSSWNRNEIGYISLQRIVTSIRNTKVQVELHQEISWEWSRVALPLSSGVTCSASGQTLPTMSKTIYISWLFHGHLGESIAPVVRKLPVHHRTLELRSKLRFLFLVLLPRKAIKSRKHRAAAIDAKQTARLQGKVKLLNEASYGAFHTFSQAACFSAPDFACLLKVSYTLSGTSEQWQIGVSKTWDGQSTEFGLCPRCTSNSP